ncbi:hypothetical protein FOPG_03054 [Fusarium oxysporum f. sp. conglutinans race 2 54008]|uniref:Uncharacterized protein n=1 Tax=Fusarium oxysporum f. sp. conglutinans race 2 54008 TaxID=1089457 RepID=X0I6F5_FUSOX|nr:hypothetical protein FOPG_03054 [Fusarium oxysporum f. sp. conglutinans race 2 54008]
MLLAVAIRGYRKSDWITYCGSAVDDLSVPLKWVAGRRLGPAEEQVRLSSWVICS